MEGPAPPALDPRLRDRAPPAIQPGALGTREEAGPQSGEAEAVGVSEVLRPPVTGRAGEVMGEVAWPGAEVGEGRAGPPPPAPPGGPRLVPPRLRRQRLDSCPRARGELPASPPPPRPPEVGGGVRESGALLPLGAAVSPLCRPEAGLPAEGALAVGPVVDTGASVPRGISPQARGGSLLAVVVPVPSRAGEPHGDDRGRPHAERRGVAGAVLDDVDASTPFPAVPPSEGGEAPRLGLPLAGPDEGGGVSVGEEVAAPAGADVGGDAEEIRVGSAGLPAPLAPAEAVIRLARPLPGLGAVRGGVAGRVAEVPGAEARASRGARLLPPPADPPARPIGGGPLWGDVAERALPARRGSRRRLPVYGGAALSTEGPLPLLEPRRDVDPRGVGRSRTAGATLAARHLPAVIGGSVVVGVGSATLHPAVTLVGDAGAGRPPPHSL